jgi:hypothetical protein
VGSARRRGPFGSVPREQTARAGFAGWIEPRQSRAGPAAEKHGPPPFFQFKSFFQLNKSEGENKNRKNIWRPQKNVKFRMEIDLNICHNFRIGHFDQRSTIFK